MIRTSVMKELRSSMPPLSSSLQFFDNFFDTPFVRSKVHYDFFFRSLPLSLLYCFFFQTATLLFAKYLLYIYHLPLANTEMRCCSSLKIKTSIWLSLLSSVKPYAICNHPTLGVTRNLRFRLRIKWLWVGILLLLRKRDLD